MTLDPHTTAGKAGLAEILVDPLHALAAFDYDGTLAPIVADPMAAYPQSGVVAAMRDLAGVFGHLAVITGRPAQQAVDLGGFADLSGLNGLVVLGHYGLERWDATTGQVESVAEPPGLVEVKQRLPAILAEHAAETAYVEDKGLSVAVHLRRISDPQQAYARLREPLRQLAETHGLVLEEARLALEVRPHGTDKGAALRRLAEQVDARSVMFTGDDVGDLAAFAEVERIRAAGGAGLLVCSGSDEVTALAERADLVVDGPAGVTALIEALVGQLTEP